jgi:hypothetical protein
MLYGPLLKVDERRRSEKYFNEYAGQWEAARAAEKAKEEAARFGCVLLILLKSYIGPLAGLRTKRLIYRKNLVLWCLKRSFAANKTFGLVM